MYICGMYVCIYVCMNVCMYIVCILTNVCVYVCMYVCMYVCKFIKLRITAQSGPAILVILCHSRLSILGGSMILVTRTSDQARQRGHTLSTGTILT